MEFCGRVRYFKQHVWSRFGFGVRTGEMSVDGEIARSKLEFAAVGHGITRVNGKIEQHLMQLPLIADNRAAQV
jgi:hypothetical protein